MAGTQHSRSGLNMPDTDTGALMSKFKSWQSYSNFPLCQHE